MSRHAGMTRRSFLCLCGLCGVALMGAPLGRAWAFERDEHDDITEEILFDHANPILGTSEREKAKKALECAVYLCLDQTGGNGESDLETLRNHGVNKLPTLDEMALTGIFNGGHDAYTHMGWHYDYGDLEVETHGEQWQERWLRRKKLLVNTVNTVFDFGFFASKQVGWLGLSDGTKCDAFAELLYYSHVLGDFQDKIQENLRQEKYEMDLKALPFATEGASDDNRDFFWDLDEALRIIANGTDAQSDYEDLSSELDSIASKARRLGTVGTKTKAESFRKYVLQTRQLLKKRVPTLLGKVDFFRNVFGTNG